MLTPEVVHYNLVEAVVEKRNIVFQKAYQSTLKRLLKGLPKAKIPENEVWINKPVSIQDVA